MENQIGDKFNRQTEQKLLSIIIPAFNVEEYLEECLDSLTRQNFNSQQYEVLIINDGSTDNTEKIALCYCNKYDYFTLINQENKGVSAARNKGLSLAQGKYIAFVDSDDFVADNIYQPIINLMERDKLEGFYFGYTKDKNKLEQFSPIYYFPKKENSCKMAVWRVVFLSKVILENKISFLENVKFCEDALFNYKYIQSLRTGIAGSAQRVYFYRLNRNSATGIFNRSNKNLEKNYYNSLKGACLELKSYTIKNNLLDDKLYNIILSSFVTNLLWGCMRLKLDAKEVVCDLASVGIYLKDIKVKTFEGKSFKYKFKSWLEYNFRHKFVFYLSCFIYRIIGK